MAAKKINIEEVDIEEDLQEILEALQNDSENGFLAFWKDQNEETVFIKCSDGDQGSISFAEFEEIKNQKGKEYLVCAGLLGLVFNSCSRPVLYLACERCEMIHKVVLGELCLTDC